MSDALLVYSPISQFTPMNPTVHVHSYPTSFELQVAPFMQGCEIHGSAKE